jgi:hypothetical protein
VPLINTDGLVLVGPGSEWFWSAAQFVAVVVSLAAIYRQIRAQGAANFMQRIETLHALWASPRMTYSRLELALHLRYEKPDAACYVKAMPLLDFFADLYNMELNGYITVDEIAANWGRSIQEWAACTAPLVEARRRQTGNPVIYDLDPLLAKVRIWERRRGAGPPPRLDSKAILALLDEAIDRGQARLRQEAAWQSGHIPERPATGAG